MSFSRPVRRPGISSAVAAAKHLNINTIELMPVNQSFAGFAIHREG
jgi:hypothetical protein